MEQTKCGDTAINTERFNLMELEKSKRLYVEDIKGLVSV